MSQPDPTTIYFDEHGFTGENLLDPDQQIFVIASTIISNKEAKLLLYDVFDKTQAKELKFSSIKRRQKGRSSIVKLVEILANEREKRVKVFVQHKKFALFTKLADNIVEILFKYQGVDFYAGKRNILFCNAGWFTILYEHGEDGLNRLLQSFQSLMRERDERHYLELIYVTTELLEASNQPVNKSVLGLIVDALKCIKLDRIQGMPDIVNDLAQSGALHLLHDWRSTVSGRLCIVHDQSKNMEKMRDTWDALTTWEGDEKRIGWDARIRDFPINVTSTIFCPSEEHPSLQLCDLVAGAFGSASRPDELTDAEFTEKLRGAGLPNLAAGSVWPDPSENYPSNISGPIDGIDPHEFMSNILKENREKRKIKK